MDDGLLYLRRKRSTITCISTAQFILGTICILLWLAAIDYCKNYSNNFNVDCTWVSPMQGLWGGAFVLICGGVGLSQGCRPTKAGNVKHITISIASILSASGMLIVEFFLIFDYLNLSQKEYEKTLLWNYFHWTLIGVGALCVLLGFVETLITCYAQCGCCGTYCDHEEDIRAYERLTDSLERLNMQSTCSGGICVHSCPYSHQLPHGHLHVQTSSSYYPSQSGPMAVSRLLERPVEHRNPPERPRGQSNPFDRRVENVNDPPTDLGVTRQRVESVDVNIPEQNDDNEGMEQEAALFSEHPPPYSDAISEGTQGT